MAGSLGFLASRAGRALSCHTLPGIHKSHSNRQRKQSRDDDSVVGLLAAEKTRHQDDREVAWPEGGGVIVARAQKSRLRRVGEVCCANFGVGSFSLGFSVGSGGRGFSRCVLDVCSLWLYENHSPSRCSLYSVKENCVSLTGCSGQKRVRVAGTQYSSCRSLHCKTRSQVPYCHSRLKRMQRRVISLLVCLPYSD